MTDPAHATILLDVRFHASRAHRYAVYALYEPGLSNTRTDDTGRTVGQALVAADSTEAQASALVGRPRFSATSTGFRGASDGYLDLLADGRMDWPYTRASAGNLVQTARTSLAGRAGGRHAVLALAFASRGHAALGAARASLHRGFGSAARAYAAGWHRYVGGLRRPPVSLSPAQTRLYRVSQMVLAASEDKTHRGAFIASPSSPWAFGRDDPSGPYHLVWSRDLYQIATGLLAGGDRCGEASSSTRSPCPSCSPDSSGASTRTRGPG